jgi:hypothetical protein
LTMLFLESPWPILIVGLVTEAILALALFRTGRGKLLWAIGGVGLVVLLGVFIEERTVTDTKLVRRTLDEVVAGLLANNAERVKACIVSGEDGDAARKETDWALRMAEFREITIHNFEVNFDIAGASSPTAEAKFMVFVRGNARLGDYRDEISRPVNIKVKLRRQSGRWLVYDLPEHDAHP